MSTRLDAVLRKYPEHEAGIREIAGRDPSGNLKYLDWGAKVLASGQALAGEIADVVELHHQHAGRSGLGLVEFPRRARVRPDIYTYRPQDLAALRDALLKIKRAKDKKRRARERLYKLDGAVEAEVIYDSEDLVVRHIRNKSASMHYGLSTKWCIAMRQERYFEEYESQNATFFFLERKAPRGDEHDKMALMFERGFDGRLTANAFTALDQPIAMMALARIFGTRIFGIFQAAYECSERYPGSILSQVYGGVASLETLRAALALALKSEEPAELLETIACNDAADAALLEELAEGAPVALAREGKRRKGRRRRRGFTPYTAGTIMAALAIHPNTPDALRKKALLSLKRRRVRIEDVRRITSPHVGVTYSKPYMFRLRHRRMSPRHLSPSQLRQRVGMYERMAARSRKWLERAEEKAAKKWATKKSRRRA